VGKGEGAVPNENLKEPQPMWASAKGPRLEERKWGKLENQISGWQPTKKVNKPPHTTSRKQQKPDKTARRIRKPMP